MGNRGISFCIFGTMGRIAWIDNCKALAISIVVLGHLESIYLVNEVLFSFAMPAFFFLSGYTFKRSASAPFIEFIRKKFRSLVIPYFGFSAILFAFWFLVRRNFGLTGQQSGITVPDVLLQIVRGVNSESFVTPLWFLTCLFVTELFFWGLQKFIKKQPAIWAIILVLFGFGIYYWFYMDIQHFSHAFWNVDQACFYLYFLSIGFAFSSRNLAERLFCNLKRNLATALVLSAVFTVAFIARESTTTTWQILLLQAVMCNASLFAFITIGNAIPQNKILNFIGQNTLTILALHIIVQSLLRGTLLKAVHLNPELLQNSLGLSLLLTLVTLAALVPAILLINRFIPWLAGKRKVR